MHPKTCLHLAHTSPTPRFAVADQRARPLTLFRISHQPRRRYRAAFAGLLGLSAAVAILLPAIPAHAQGDGSLDTTFNPGGGANGQPVNGEPVNGRVQSVAVQADGKIVLGGYFSTFDGAPHNNIVRLNADGSVDMGFSTILGAGSLNGVAVQQDGKILIVGSFRTVNGAGRENIARLNANGSLDTGFNPDFDTYATLNALILQDDGKILVGGGFSTINGMSRKNIARLNADGSLDTIFNPGSGPDNPVYTVAVQADGKIVIGGSFDMVNEIFRGGIARLNANGNLDQGFSASTTSFGSSPGFLVGLVVQADGKIVFVGGFEKVNGVPRGGIARLNSDGSLDAGFNANIDASDNSSKYGYAAGVQVDGKIVVGGYFSIIDGVARNNLARLNSNGSLDTSFDPGSGTDSPINSVIVQANGKIVLGGQFTVVNGVPRRGIARLNGTPPSPPPTHPPFFRGETALGNNLFYLQFPNGNFFGFYSDLYYPFLYHYDLGYEYVFDVNDGEGGVYLYDYASGHYFYTSPNYPFPYLYDYTLRAILYYFPDPNREGHYTSNPRTFVNLSTGEIISL